MAHIIIDDLDPRVSYTVGGSSQSSFPVPFAFFANSDLVVTAGAVVLDEGTDYIVTGFAVDAGFSSGTVDLVTAVTNVDVLIERILPIERTTDFPDSGPLSIRALNTQFDKVAAWCQQIQGADDLLAQRVTDWIALISTSITTDIVTVNVATRGAAVLASFSALTLYIRTAGYYDAGDGGGALYKYVASGGDFTSADGKQWLLAEKIINPYMTGARGNSTTADQAAIADALSRTDEIALPMGDFRISANTTWANGKKIVALQGATIAVDGGVTLTINGLFEAGWKTVFTGAGTVIGLRRVRPQWFKAGASMFATSTTSLTIQNGVNKTFTTTTGRPVVIGARARAWSAADPTKWMEGTVSSYSGTTLVLSVDTVKGAGTFADWTLDSNDYNAFTKAIACLEHDDTSISDGDSLILELGRKRYPTGNGIIITPTLYAQMVVQGAGTGQGGSIIAALPDFSGGSLLQLAGNTDAQRSLANYKLSRFTLENAPSGLAGTGLRIGKDTGTLDALYGANLIENVHITDFVNGLHIRNARLVKVHRSSVSISSVSNAYGVLIDASAGNNTGEIDLENVNIACDPGNNSTGVLIGTGVGGAVSGWCLNRCIVYHATLGIDVSASGGGNVSDGAVIGQCQIDGIGGTAMKIHATGAGSYVEDVDVTGLYARGLTVAGIIVQATAGGRVANSEIALCKIMNVAGPSVLVDGCVGIKIDHNRFFDPNPGAANPVARFSNSTQACSFDSNTIMLQVGSTAAAKYFVQWDLGNDHFTCRGNSAGDMALATGVLNDVSGAVTKSVGDNI